MIQRFFRDERGSTALEYALIAAIIFFAVLGGVGLVGDSLGQMFGSAQAGFEQ